MCSVKVQNVEHTLEDKISCPLLRDSLTELAQNRVRQVDPGMLGN